MKLILGDCLEIMPTLPDKSVDMILCDLPYGTTACKWDTVIPFEPLWTQYKRLIKDRGAIVLTASQPFTSALVMSNPKMFRYEWIWDKVNKYTGFMNAKIRPLKKHENILIFTAGRNTYNPQKKKVTPYKSRRSKTKDSDTQGTNAVDYGRMVSEKNPDSILQFEGNITNGCLHPTQKPVALFEYLIRTYTNEGDTVMDNCAGSGTTGVACINAGRDFILIEKDAGYFAIIEKRIAEAQRNPLTSA